MSWRGARSSILRNEARGGKIIRLDLAHPIDEFNRRGNTVDKAGVFQALDNPLIAVIQARVRRELKNPDFNEIRFRGRRRGDGVEKELITK